MSSGPTTCPGSPRGAPCLFQHSEDLTPWFLVSSGRKVRAGAFASSLTSASITSALSDLDLLPLSYMGPICIIWDHLLIPKSLNCHVCEVLLPCTITYSQILRVRMWPWCGEGTIHPTTACVIHFGTCWFRGRAEVITIFSLLNL